MMSGWPVQDTNVISWTTLRAQRREKGAVMMTRRMEAAVRSQVNTLGASSHIWSAATTSSSIRASSALVSSGVSFGIAYTNLLHCGNQSLPG